MTVEWRYNRVQRGVVCPTTEPVKPKLPKRFKCTRGSQTPKTAKHLHKLLAKKLKTKMFKNINRNSGLPTVYKMCVLKSFSSKLNRLHSMRLLPICMQIACTGHPAYHSLEILYPDSIESWEMGWKLNGQEFHWKKMKNLERRSVATSWAFKAWQGSMPSA